MEATAQFANLIYSYCTGPGTHVAPWGVVFLTLYSLTSSSIFTPGGATVACPFASPRDASSGQSQWQSFERHERSSSWSHPDPKEAASCSEEDWSYSVFGAADDDEEEGKDSSARSCFLFTSARQSRYRRFTCKGNEEGKVAVFNSFIYLHAYTNIKWWFKYLSSSAQLPLPQGINTLSHFLPGLSLQLINGCVLIADAERREENTTFWLFYSQNSTTAVCNDKAWTMQVPVKNKCWFYM